MQEPKDLLSEDHKEQVSAYEMNGPYVKPILVLTDEDVVADRPVQWSGIPLKCPECGNNAILHFMKHCGECGVSIVVRSNKVNNYVNKIQGNYNGI